MADEPAQKPEGDRPFIGGGLGVGLAIGVGLGVALDNLGLGIALGVALGFIIGAATEQSVRNKDKGDGE